MNYPINTGIPFDPNSMAQWGQLGTGTYGNSIAVPQQEFFSQPVVPTDWTKQAMIEASGPNFNSGATNMSGPGANTGFLDGALGPNGWGGLALNAAGGLASTFLGMKQYGLAKQTLAENKRQFQLNYDAQKRTTNTRLEDRQRARVASNANAYQSVGDYMTTNGIQ